MPDRVVLLSLPGLREKDLVSMPALRQLMAEGDIASLVPSFPAVTCPAQVNMTTGAPPREHGVIANGFYWRETGQVEMWTAWNKVIERPQIWDTLHQHDASLTSAVWFPLLSKGCGADYICTPAPIHNPDGSESLWCYTQPTEMYGQLRDTIGHFPLQHFWGPLANVKSSVWIADSAAWACQQYQPRFTYIYLPHLDYAAQKHGPDSPDAKRALEELDRVIGKLGADVNRAFPEGAPLWLAASEYVISPVDHVSFPNRILREAGYLALDVADERETLNPAASRAFALVDHQFSHVFVRDPADVGRVANLFRGKPGFAEVLAGEDLAKYDMDHPRSGEVVLISTPNSWQAYYWWLDDAQAPAFARTVDIHRKPGYDPVELFFDPGTKGIPLNAKLVRGSHGAPAYEPSQRGVFLSSERGTLPGPRLADVDVASIVLQQFGI